MIKSCLINIFFTLFFINFRKNEITLYIKIKKNCFVETGDRQWILLAIVNFFFQFQQNRFLD